MKCNLKECYWNMWSPKHKMFNNDSSMVCVSENLSEHYDESKDFKLLPNDNNVHRINHLLVFAEQ
ncbi:hypothetical protein P4S77_14430, partial [Anoxybacillus ayderensis]|nr:hypothetical protein [Anoxybacillus ayderensis]